MFKEKMQKWNTWIPIENGWKKFEIPPPKLRKSLAFYAKSFETRPYATAAVKNRRTSIKIVVWTEIKSFSKITPIRGIICNLKRCFESHQTFIIDDWRFWAHQGFFFLFWGKLSRSAFCSGNNYCCCSCSFAKKFSPFETSPPPSKFKRRRWWQKFPS